MKKYKVLKDFTFEGKQYTEGQEVSLDETKAAHLVSEGKLEAI